jgi:hypothetical protein
LDSEISAAAKALFLASDLVRPGPGLLPFGSKARNRKTRRREVDEIAAARRAVLTELLMARRNARVGSTPAPTGRRRPAMVATLLAAIVIAIAVVGWWMSLATPAASSDDKSDMPAAPTNPVVAETRSATFLVTGDSRPGPGQITIEPDSPEEAASAWLAAWCPGDPHQSKYVADDAIRDLMTAAGWAEFRTTPGQTTAGLRPGLTASCDTPKARVVSRPPDTDSAVAVQVSATRTLTDVTKSAPARTFGIERRQYVVRGDDGRWRVDVAAVGG